MMQVHSVGLGVIPAIVDQDNSGPEVESVFIPGPRGLTGGTGSPVLQFAGDWDMSIGEPGGPPALTVATLAALTGTTITPDSPLTVTGTYLFTGGETARIQLADPNPDSYAVFALTMPAGSSSGVQIRYWISVLCNSGADAADIEAIFNGDAPSTAVWAVGVMYDISAYPLPQVKTFTIDNSALDLSNPFVGTSFIYGDVWPFVYDYPTATLSDFAHESVSVVLDTAAITAAGQQLKLIAGGLAESGRTQSGYGAITYGQNGFLLTADAYLPAGAVDENWYRVTGAGTFAGVETVIGDYVKLISGMTGIIAVHYGTDGAPGPQGDPGPAGADGAPGADGAQGPQGDPGPAGADGAPGADGAQGDPGPAGATGATGATGAQGTAATIAVGTVTTGAAGSAASITNVGTSSAAIFDFTIPRGDTGAGGGGAVTISGKTGAYTVVAGDLGTVINCTANTFTVSLTAAATLGAGFHCWVWNTSNTSSHVITIDPNGSETIDGATTLLLRRGEGCQIICDGTNWQTGDMKKPRLYSENALASVTRPVASGGNSVAIGSGATATVSSAVAMGETATATGTNAVALGKARAATSDSFAAQIGDSTTTYGAKTAANTIAMGYLAVASGQYAAVLGGSSCQAQSAYSCVIGGGSATALGTYSVVLGGYATISSGHGKVVSGTGMTAFAGQGTAQTGTMTIARNTTNGTPTVLLSDNGTAGTLNQLTLANNQSMAVTGRVIAQRKGSESTTSTAMWTFNAVIRRGANAASTALVAAVTPTLIAADADAAAWTVAVTADTTNGALAVTVTGEAAKNIRWVCTLESTETIYS